MVSKWDHIYRVSDVSDNFWCLPLWQCRSPWSRTLLNRVRRNFSWVFCSKICSRELLGWNSKGFISENTLSFSVLFCGRMAMTGRCSELVCPPAEHEFPFSSLLTKSTAKVRLTSSATQYDTLRNIRIFYTMKVFCWIWYGGETQKKSNERKITFIVISK